jgi:ferredoxin
MAFVVTESCIRCKYTDCVSVCPMDCFLEGPNFLVINPNECIDCTMCVPECPVGAIVSEHEITVDQSHFVQLNRELSSSAGWTQITQSKSPLPDHERWASVQEKLDLLEQWDGRRIHNGIECPRVSHTSIQANGLDPVSASSKIAKGATAFGYDEAGKPGLVATSAPRQLSTDEVARVVQDFANERKRSAANATIPVVGETL